MNVNLHMNSQAAHAHETAVSPGRGEHGTVGRHGTSLSRHPSAPAPGEQPPGADSRYAMQTPHGGAGGVAADRQRPSIPMSGIPQGTPGRAVEGGPKHSYMQNTPLPTERLGGGSVQVSTPRQPYLCRALCSTSDVQA